MSQLGQSRHFGRRPTTSGPPPETDIPEPVGMSQRCRFCCKSRKSNDPENLAKDDFRRAATLRSAITPLRRSVVVLPKNDVVPHVATCDTRVPENFRSSPQKDFCS